MDKLYEPSKFIIDFYDKLIENKRNNVNNNFLKDRLTKIKEILIFEENNYIIKSKSSQLYSIAESNAILVPSSSEVVSKDEMESLYTQNLVSFPGSDEIGREIYDYLKSLALDSMCPYCTISKASTLDHYLPKSEFPIYAVTPANLVPCCRECNSTKDTNYSHVKEEMFVHPYYEDVDNFIWLDCLLEKDIWPLSFKYRVIVKNDANYIMAKRIDYQHKLLKLTTFYNDKANRLFRSRVKNIIKNYETGGVDSVRSLLLDAEESCRCAELNSWEACMYKSLLHSEWFFSHAIQMLMDKYIYSVRL